MARSQKITCDLPGCGAEKRDVNRWWILKINQASFEVLPWRRDAAGETKEYCGRGHLAKAVEALLDLYEEDHFPQGGK